MTLVTMLDQNRPNLALKERPILGRHGFAMRDIYVCHRKRQNADKERTSESTLGSLAGQGGKGEAPDYQASTSTMQAISCFAESTDTPAGCCYDIGLLLFTERR